MTEDKIHKGTELLHKLKNLKEDREIWRKGATLQRIVISDKYDYINDDDLYIVRSGYVGFKKLKEDTLANIDKMIEETQKEFDNL